jgi:hypothetical protein
MRTASKVSFDDAHHQTPATAFSPPHYTPPKSVATPQAFHCKQTHKHRSTSTLPSSPSHPPYNSPLPSLLPTYSTDTSLIYAEHVLRPSVSANLIGVSSTKPFQASSTPAIAPAAPTAPNKKPSPSPSIKRGKAERLLKEHGSPPGMRVTAGGRVVPSDLPPLSTARFGGNNIFKPQALRSVASGNSMSAQAQPDDNNVPRVQVVGNQPVVWIGDRVYALPTFNAATTAMPSALVPPAMEAAKQVAEPLMPIQPYLTK